MCGIAGCVVPPGGRPDRAALERMAGALAHRGPDDRGIDVTGQVGLVTTRLAIVDPSPAGHGPMATADGRWVLTYNGELFDHEAVRARLVADGDLAPWRSGSDTETVLRALARWGDGALERFNALFALAAVDRAAGRVLLARDRFGVKPLYLARHGGALWFASEQRALLAAGVPAVPDGEALGHAISQGWLAGRGTCVAGIERVLPGTVVAVDLATLTTTERRWFAPADLVDPERPALRGDEARGTARAALGRAVERRLAADVPVGTLLSGGIDSAIVTALAAERAAGLPAYHVSLADQPAHDELAHAEQVARTTGAELRVVHMRAEDWRRGFVDAVAHHEYPLLHPSTVPMAQLAALARDDGVKVLLSGEGADELFGGYPWSHPAERRAFARRGLVRVRRSPAPAGPSAAAVAFEQEALARAHAAYAHHRGPRRALEAALLGDLDRYLPHLLMRDDKATMQASIETRMPFLDPEVAATAVTLPLEERVRPQLKPVLRDLARELVPGLVIDRPKQGFGFDVSRILAGATRADFLVEGRLREVLGTDVATWRANLAREPWGRWPLRIVSAEVWCRVLIDGGEPGEIAEELWADAAAPLAA